MRVHKKPIPNGERVKLLEFAFEDAGDDERWRLWKMAAEQAARPRSFQRVWLRGVELT